MIEISKKDLCGSKWIKHSESMISIDNFCFYPVSKLLCFMVFSVQNQCKYSRWPETFGGQAFCHDKLQRGRRFLFQYLLSFPTLSQRWRTLSTLKRNVPCPLRAPSQPCHPSWVVNIFLSLRPLHGDVMWDRTQMQRRSGWNGSIRLSPRNTVIVLPSFFW